MLQYALEFNLPFKQLLHLNVEVCSRSYDPQGYLNLSKAIAQHKTDEFLMHKLHNVWELYSHSILWTSRLFESL